jgi:hypothetical protein
VEEYLRNRPTSDDERDDALVDKMSERILRLEKLVAVLLRGKPRKH